MPPAWDRRKVLSAPDAASRPEGRAASSAALSMIAEPRRWFTFTTVALLAGFGWTFISRIPPGGETQGQIASPRVGFAAPDFTLELLGGGQVTLSELHGKAVVVNLWASWCPPCRAEMPALQRVYEENRERGLEIVALNTTFQDSESDAAAFVAEFGLTFPVALDRDGAASRAYLLRALPTTYFIDRTGVIREVVIGGPMSDTTIQTTVEKLLTEE